ncbi:hypothetical protein FACS189419_01720 [Planctomycetales bacterium]|nr:hypothetical protein FACS189419_01720 [Planctomycetales bacterium]
MKSFLKKDILGGKTQKMKRFIALFLIISLICPVMNTLGCKAQPKNSKPASVFSFPKFKKENKTVKKDSNGSGTVEEFLASPHVTPPR